MSLPLCSRCSPQVSLLSRSLRTLAHFLFIPSPSLLFHHALSCLVSQVPLSFYPFSHLSHSPAQRHKQNLLKKVGEGKGNGSSCFDFLDPVRQDALVPDRRITWPTGFVRGAIFNGKSTRRGTNCASSAVLGPICLKRHLESVWWSLSQTPVGNKCATKTYWFITGSVSSDSQCDHTDDVPVDIEGCLTHLLAIMMWLRIPGVEV